MSQATFDPTKYNNSDNTPFSEVVEKELSRRSVLRGGAGIAAMSLFAGAGLVGCSDDDDDAAADVAAAVEQLNFSSIPGSKTDSVAIADGYSAKVLAPWGEPLNSAAAAWKADGTNTAEDQANSVGMHHDGMYFYPLNGSDTDGVLCINHEYIDQNALHPNGRTEDAGGNRTIAEEIRKEINAHGVTTVRVQLVNGSWQIVKDDPLNRRFTGATEMDITGPLADHPSLITKYAQARSVARGTLNNCGNGFTPWGTYLTCEENWPGYFTKASGRTDADNRIGVGSSGTRYSWEDLAGDASEQNDEFTRFDATPSGANALEDYRNEANGHGYIVEIDPYDGSSRAKKRTALGRFRHEGCVHGTLTAGEPVVFYSGHDGRFEYIYKFVSAAAWDPADADRTDRLNVGSKYMDEGTLYVARFDEAGVGVWLPLTMDGATTDGGKLSDSYASLAEIILDTAGAADKVGATPMDRPEWAAVDPFTGSVYFTLTNNTRRDGSSADAQANPANPRLNNSFGHIIRWDEGSTATSFNWEIFLFGAPSDAAADVNRSGLTDLNQLASPDGLVFDDRGIMWVQTDNGASEVTEETNDQMLAIIPSKLVDENGKQKVLTSENQAELKRFFVGPNGCEVTGLAFTPDYKHFFANIQHPGNWPFSNDAAEVTPAGTSVRPRAAVVAIAKNDGGTIGA